ncbi:thioredoxin domain-containing protein [Intrasporangium calvum]|uniref:Thioredoxin domain-containing protein n=1 Tax=Intrasporangium calvum TaxID=53358 RepID=A0ABT5GJX0_9MICO|nr:thioredoxin domain-containing protein [Intrasporangium calvum]MDC5698306.1 thioredoxin domain-containing protein [Intrasporangium calvum]
MSNRLAEATSPYLLQHRDNPVHWQEWGDAAFAEARERNVPVLLSVGYAACHWCHVMAHESFEDEAVAQALNERFVSVKVDREERPDIDAVYMAAVTATTGHGGWPMTCFLTPEGQPFFCGTYFPRDHFLRVLAGIDEAWRTREDEVRASGLHITSALREGLASPEPYAAGLADLDRAVTLLSGQFDSAAGGFGNAPKFPPSMVLEFLLRHHARTGDGVSLAMADRTLDAMARSGMYDQVGGGFARYAVDAKWVVPHFEKMLYDNALLLRVYAHWWRVDRNPLAEKVVRETVDFLLSELRTAEGGFASSLDADTDGVEGLTYVWTPAQLAEVLGEDDGARAGRLFTVTEHGTFEHGTSTLQLLVDPDDPEWFGDARTRLTQARAKRPQPGRDDKVVTSWNGLAIAALAEAGAIFEEPEWIAAAGTSAELLLDLHVVDGDLRRASRDGRVGAAAGVADDYGNVAEGLLALHQATGEARWLTVAGHLLRQAQDRFGAEDGGFHDTAADAEQLFLRPRSGADNAEPSGQSAIAVALVTLGALTGDPETIEAGRRGIDAGMGLAGREPRFGGWTLAGAEALAAGPLQVAVVGSGPEAEALARTTRLATSPGLVMVQGAPDTPGVPLLEGRPLVGGNPAAYVCRGFVCDRPVATVEDLSAALSARL